MRQVFIKMAALCAVTSLGLVACSGTDGFGFAQAKSGKSVYDRQCMQCHGNAGTGAGPASLGLGIAPPELRTLSRQNDGVFPRAELIRIIAGYAGRDDPDAAMPDFGTHSLANGVAEPDLAEAGPLPDELSALLRYLESIQE